MIEMGPLGPRSRRIPPDQRPRTIAPLRYSRLSKQLTQISISRELHHIGMGKSLVISDPTSNRPALTRYTYTPPESPRQRSCFSSQRTSAIHSPRPHAIPPSQWMARPNTLNPVAQPHTHTHRDTYTRSYAQRERDLK